VKKLIITLFVLLGIQNANAETLNLYIGEIKILEVGAVERVAVGNGDLVSTSVLDNGQLLVIAEKEGDTGVHIWYNDGSESDLKVIVLKQDANREVMELRTLLEGVGDIEVREVGQRVYLSGTIYNNDEQGLAILDTVAKSFGDAINIVRKISPEAEDTIFIQSKMVHMDVKITEFKVTDTTTLGIQWDTGIAGPSAGASAIGTNNSSLLGAAVETPLNFANAATGVGNINSLGFFGIATEIASRINLAVQNGNAILLAEPKLSARSGGSASFLVGGEVPIETSGALGSTNIEYKEFGILLDISPTVDAKNNILTLISTEVSAIDAALQSTNGTPGFATRKTETDISIRDGQTLVLSGLIDRDTSKTVDKFPFLGDIPVLGVLFRSTAYRNEDTELIIFVTPTVYDANSEFNQKKVDRRQEMIDMFQERTDLILD
jgi:pilus assembly protein CpaC